MSYCAKLLVVLVSVGLAGSCPDVVPRKAWRAKEAKHPEKMEEPVPYVVIHHTYIPPVCNTTKECKRAMRDMQSYHQNTQKWSDIGYNFCIGGDGKIYEGRGWGTVGAHAPLYNSKSIGICYIGDYRTNLPNEKMLQSGKELIECGVDEGHIDENYDLVGHRQIADELLDNKEDEEKEETVATVDLPYNKDWKWLMMTR